MWKLADEGDDRVELRPVHLVAQIDGIDRIIDWIEPMPDPDKIGNSGSFFKNPIVSKKTFQRFRKKYPSAPFYAVSENEFKIPAGWLIEQCGFKGKRFGDAGIHKNQALVLVNYGNATGQEIWNLALTIQASVKEKFGITILPEVNVIK